MFSDFEHALKKNGWQILPGSIEDYFDGDASVAGNTLNQLTDKLLNLDLNKFGSTASTENQDASAPVRVKADLITGPLVLQIQRVLNVSAPKANETSQGAPQLLKVTVTDGNAVYHILQTGSWNSISLDTPPGTKLLLKNGQTCRVHCGFLPLKQNQFSVLGGTVEPLVEKWQLTKVFGLNRNRESGAPKWVPFGNKIASTTQAVPGQFKSLESEAKQVKENEAFDQQRKANLEEIAKAYDVKKKTFEKVPQSEPQSYDDRFQNNRGRFGNQSRGGFTGGRTRGERSSDADRPRFERRTNSRREDREESDSHSLPSKPTTLFDFLTNKLTDPEVKNDGTFSAINNATQMEFKPYGEKKPEDQRGYDDNRRGRHSGHFNRGGPRNHSDTGRSRSDHDSNSSYNQRNSFSEQSRQTVRGNQRSDFQSSHQGHQQRTSGRDYKQKDYQPPLEAGDKVLAKYWEDQKMHRALVSQVNDAGNTCVIQFVDYDNYEEVFIKDVQSCQPHVWDSFRPGSASTAPAAESVGGQRKWTDQSRRHETHDHNRYGQQQQSRDVGGHQQRYGQPRRDEGRRRPGGEARAGRGGGQRPFRDFEDHPDVQFSGTFEFRRRGSGSFVQGGGGGRGGGGGPPRDEQQRRRPPRGDRLERQLYRPPRSGRPQGPYT